MKRIILCMIIIAMTVVASAQQQYTEEVPRATLAGKSSGMITLDEINSAGKLQSGSPKLQIVHFALTMISDGVLVSRVAQNDKISAAMMDQLKKLNKGQRFIVDEISALKHNGQIIPLKALKFTLD